MRPLNWRTSECWTRPSRYDSQMLLEDGYKRLRVDDLCRRYLLQGRRANPIPGKASNKAVLTPELK